MYLLRAPHSVRQRGTSPRERREENDEGLNTLKKAHARLQAKNKINYECIAHVAAAAMIHARTFLLKLAACSNIDEQRRVASVWQPTIRKGRAGM